MVSRAFFSAAPGGARERETVLFHQDAFGDLRYGSAGWHNSAGEQTHRSIRGTRVALVYFPLREGLLLYFFLNYFFLGYHTKVRATGFF